MKEGSLLFDRLRGLGIHVHHPAKQCDVDEVAEDQVIEACCEMRQLSVCPVANVAKKANAGVEYGPHECLHNLARWLVIKSRPLQELRQMRVLDEIREDAIDVRRQPVRASLLIARALRHHADKHRDAALKDGFVQRLLIRKVVIEAGLVAQADIRCNIANARARVPSLREPSFRRVKNHVPRRDRHCHNINHHGDKYPNKRLFVNCLTALITQRYHWVMPIPPFDQSGLLPIGIHWAAWAEVEERFGHGSSKRRALCVGLKAALDNLRLAGCKELYVDGSFVTSKVEPGDFDGCWNTDGVDLDVVDPVLLDLAHPRAAQKAKFGGELFPTGFDAARGGPTFLEFFQIDRSGDPKGIVGLKVRDGHD